MNDKSATTPCPACRGRGYIGEPRVIYPEPQIGRSVDASMRYAVETCPVCQGSGQQ